jgi:hypothetical protein
MVDIQWGCGWLTLNGPLKWGIVILKKRDLELDVGKLGMGGFLSPKSPWVSGLSHLDDLGVPPWLTRPPYISSNVKDVKPPDAQIHVKPVEVIWICAIRAPGKWPLDAPHWNVLETSCHQGNRLHDQIQPRKEDEKPAISWGVWSTLDKNQHPTSMHHTCQWLSTMFFYMFSCITGMIILLSEAISALPIQKSWAA